MCGVQHRGYLMLQDAPVCWDVPQTKLMRADMMFLGNVVTDARYIWFNIPIANTTVRTHSPWLRQHADISLLCSNDQSTSEELCRRFTMQWGKLRYVIDRAMW